MARVQLWLNASRLRISYKANVHDWYLNDWLKSLRVSQAELCRRTDYPKAKVSNLVTGTQRYNRDVLNDIALALHLEPHELLMHPADAMAQRQMRKLANEMVKLPYGGTASTDLPEDERTGTLG